MKRLITLRTFAFLSAWALIHLPATASACAACMGNPNSKTAIASNGAIFLLLGAIGMVLSGIGAFAYSLFRRANNPPDPALTALMTAQEASK